MLSFLVFVLIFDLVTKYVIESKMKLGEEASFLPGFMNFVIVHNDGAAWNLFSGFQVLLIIVTIIFLIVYSWFFFSKKSKSLLLGIASGLLLGGCLGNLYDRIFLGYVRDFLHFQFINFPVFNIADTSLCIGVFLLAVYFIFIYPKELKKEKQELEKQGVKVDGSGEVYTDDLDKIGGKKKDLKDFLNIKKLVSRRSNKKNSVNKQVLDVEAAKDIDKKDKKSEEESDER